MALQKNVFIAAGHGGTDVGAVGNGTNERDECIRIVNLVVAKLHADGRLNVYLVPHSLGLRDSISWVNARTSNADSGYSIEIHKNCCNASGTETWYPAPSSVSKSLAGIFQSAMAAYVGTPNRGIKSDSTNRHGQLGWCRDVKTRSNLIEAGFIVGESLQTERHAEGVYRGVLAVFSLAPQSVPVPQPPAPKLSWIRMEVPRQMVAKETLRIINLNNNQYTGEPIKKGTVIDFVQKTGWNGTTYLRSKYSQEKGLDNGIDIRSLEELPVTPPPKPEVPPAQPATDARVLAYRKNYVLTGSEVRETNAGANFVDLVTGKLIMEFKSGDEFVTYSTFEINGQRYFTTKYSHDKIMKENILPAVVKEGLRDPATQEPPKPPAVDDYQDPKSKDLDKRVSALEKIVESILDFLKGLGKK